MMTSRAHHALQVPTVIQRQDDEYDRVHGEYYAAQDRIIAAKLAAADMNDDDDEVKIAITHELAAAEAAFHPIQQAFLANRERAMPTECYQLIASYLDRLSRVRLATCDHHLHDWVIYGPTTSSAAMWRQGDELEKAYGRSRDWMMTPLLHAIQTGAMRAVRTLIAAKADVHLHDELYHFTGLHIACGEGHERLVELLLKVGLDVDELGRYGMSPLLFAGASGHVSIVRRLLAAGAHVDYGEGCDRPLMGASSDNCATVVTALLEAHADINYADVDGWTCLHHAARNGATDVIPVLITGGADFNARGNDDETPIMCACRNKQCASVAALVAAGADINITDHFRRSPLMWASRYGDDGIVNILLAAGADVHLVDNGGDTALAWARRCRYDSTVALLLAAGKVDDDGPK